MKKTIRLSFLSALLAAGVSFAGDLPPDPGRAGKATLTGIDSDHDGVRDDVRRWIALTFPDSQKIRAALTQRAKVNQQFILHAANPAKSKRTAIGIQRSSACLAYVLPNDYYDVANEFRAVFFNTSDRSKALIQANHHLSGSVPTLVDYEDRKKGCDFDPDKLPD